MKHSSRWCQQSYIFWIVLFSLLFVSCSQNAPVRLTFSLPDRAMIYHVNLPALQRLRDPAADFTGQRTGADTGIQVMPGEKIVIFASGSTPPQPGGQATGPGGDPACSRAQMSEHNLPCYAVIYSLGLATQAALVGDRVAFTPTTVSNLFLGVNMPLVASNAKDGSKAGAFAITVVVIPPGGLTGLWAEPNAQFAVQGTTVKLSAYILSQKKLIQNVQFTLALPGNQSETLCSATSSDGELYSCSWDFHSNGHFVPNGALSFGFIVSGEGGKQVVNPDGMRVGQGRYAETWPGANYAGYAAIDLEQHTSFKKVSATWTVPQANCVSGENSHSSIWVGLTRTPSTGKLSQIITESACFNGQPEYTAFWEVYPDNAAQFIAHRVFAGDTITASVSYQNGKYTMSMDNLQRGWHFSISRAGPSENAQTAECILETPTIVDDPNNLNGHLAPLTNFGSASISCQVNDQPIGNGPENYVFQMVSAQSNYKAKTSDLEADGSTFTVKWIHG